jgi:hypothetical protein
MSAWDKQCAHVLLFSLFREHPSVSWRRIIQSLLLSDLNDTEPYDGSAGPVATLFKELLALPAEDMALSAAQQAILSSSQQQLDPSIFAPFRNPSHLAVYPELDGFTLLHMAAAAPGALGRQNSDRGALVVSALSQAGVRINEVDRTGRTALHVAACSLNLGMVIGLVEQGASVSLVDQSGATPLRLLIAALGKRCWHEVASSDTVIRAIVALVGNDYTVFWRYEDDEDKEKNTNMIKKQARNAAQLEAALGSSLLAGLVRTGDEIVIRDLVTRCKVMTKPSVWHSLALIRHVLSLAIRRTARRRGKDAAGCFEFLWGCFESVLMPTPSAQASSGAVPSSAGGPVSSVSDADVDKIAFLHSCLAAAAASASWFALAFLQRKLASIRLLLDGWARSNPVPLDEAPSWFSSRTALPVSALGPVPHQCSGRNFLSRRLFTWPCCAAILPSSICSYTLTACFLPTSSSPAAPPHPPMPTPTPTRGLCTALCPHRRTPALFGAWRVGCHQCSLLAF